MDLHHPGRELTSLHLGGVGLLHGQAAALNPLNKTREKLAGVRRYHRGCRGSVFRFIFLSHGGALSLARRSREVGFRVPQIIRKRRGARASPDPDLFPRPCLFLSSPFVGVERGGWGHSHASSGAKGERCALEQGKFSAKGSHAVIFDVRQKTFFLSAVALSLVRVRLRCCCC